MKLVIYSIVQYLTTMLLTATENFQVTGYSLCPSAFKSRRDRDALFINPLIDVHKS